MERLDMLRRMTGDDAADTGLLEILLSNAEDTVLDIIGRDSVPSRLESAVVQLALIAYNRQGAEGEASRSEGGMSASFLDDLPADMKRRLLNYPRKARVIRDEDDEATA